MANAQSNTVWTLVKELAKKRGITEITINDENHVFVEREGKFIQLQYPLVADHITQFAKDVAMINDRPLGDGNPILDGNLPDGSRINIIMPPYTPKTPAITIRKYLRSIKTFEMDEYIFKLGPKWIQFIRALIACRKNIIVSGGTGVGKTTFMNLVLHEINPVERVLVIEDTRELSVQLPNLVQLEARQFFKKGTALKIRDLVKNALRMRPDRIIVGEVRGEEIFDLLQAMNTGHEGSMCSIHSNSPKECLSRMETLYLLGTSDIPMVAVRKQISSSVDFIIQLKRDRDGKRCVDEIFEVTGMEGGTILSQAVAKRENGLLEFTGLAPRDLQEFVKVGGLENNFFMTF